MIKKILEENGIYYKQGVHRFADNSEMYEKFLVKFFSGDSFEKLETALAQKDYKNAFRTAHDIKGSTGNLSINELYESISRLVELLRNATDEAKINEEYKTVVMLYRKAKYSVLEK